MKASDQDRYFQLHLTYTVKQWGTRKTWVLSLSWTTQGHPPPKSLSPLGCSTWGGKGAAPGPTRLWMADHIQGVNLCVPSQASGKEPSSESLQKRRHAGLGICKVPPASPTSGSSRSRSFLTPLERPACGRALPSLPH